MTRRQFLLAGAGAGLGTASCRGQSVASLAATDSGAELAYWQDQAALIDPAAYVWTHGAGFSLNVPAGKRWYARNLSAIKADGYRVDRGCSTIATSGPRAFILNDPAITTADLGKRVSGPNITASAPATSETYVVDVRNPGQAIMSHPATAAASGFSVEVWSDRYLRDPSINAAQMMPSGEAIHGASALSVETASAYICKPELVIPAPYGSGSDNRYLTDPRALYYTRLQMLQALAPHNVAAVVPYGAPAGTIERTFLPTGFATGIVTGVTSMNASWTTLDTATKNGAINLFHEISDNHALRWALDGILLPFQRSVFQAIVCMGLGTRRSHYPNWRRPRGHHLNEWIAEQRSLFQATRRLVRNGYCSSGRSLQLSPANAAPVPGPEL